MTHDPGPHLGTSVGSQGRPDLDGNTHDAPPLRAARARIEPVHAPYGTCAPRVSFTDGPHSLAGRGAGTFASREIGRHDANPHWKQSHDLRSARLRCS